MRRLLPVAAGLLGSLAFFRNAIFSGFDKVMGIRFDTGLVVFLHEHWWKVLKGNASWLSPNFMYPSTKTLGFTDTYFLDTLLYAPLRLLGVEPFLAFQLTAILLGWIGYAGWFLVLRRWIGATVGSVMLKESCARRYSSMYQPTPRSARNRPGTRTVSTARDA